MNNKSQTLALIIMTSIVVFIVGIMIINFLMPEITTARTSLNCSDEANISDGTKLLCLAIDLVIPYWIWIVISASIGIIIGRFLL